MDEVTINNNRGGSATFSKAAVAADAEVCSTVGANILKKGGSAVDAAIATQLCLGVVDCHKTGIGGGGYMVVYNANSCKAHAIDFRETAGRNASTHMFDGVDVDAHLLRGILAIAVPGELRGFEMAWQKFGHLEWHELFEPAVRLASDGVIVTKQAAEAISSLEKYILSGDYPGLKELFAPKGKILVQGDILKQPLLAQTLRNIGEKGADYLYKGEFAKQMVAELQENGSILTLQDFEEYTAIKREVTKSKFKGHDVFSVSAPGGGPVLGLIMNILDQYDFNSNDLDGMSLHRVVEAMKFAHAQKLKLGDPAFDDSISKVTDVMQSRSIAMDMFKCIDDSVTFDPDHYIDPKNTPIWEAHDNGTCHHSVLASNGDAVAITSTINSYFGCFFRSQRSGVIFNNQMSDFSRPGRDCSFETTNVNSIQPGKRPLSSITPTIVTNEEGVKLVLGASGGGRITTAIAQVILSVIGFSRSLNETIQGPRLHHALIPNYVSVERNYPDDLRKSLETKGHKVVCDGRFAVVQGIHVDKGLIHATCDPRKGGVPDGY